MKYYAFEFQLTKIHVRRTRPKIKLCGSYTTIYIYYAKLATMGTKISL